MRNARQVGAVAVVGADSAIIITTTSTNITARSADPSMLQKSFTELVCFGSMRPTGPSIPILPMLKAK